MENQKTPEEIEQEYNQILNSVHKKFDKKNIRSSYLDVIFMLIKVNLVVFLILFVIWILCNIFFLGDNLNKLYSIPYIKSIIMLSMSIPSWISYFVMSKRGYITMNFKFYKVLCIVISVIFFTYPIVQDLTNVDSYNKQKYNSKADVTQVQNHVIQNQIPFYSVDNHDEVSINLYYVSEQVYVEYTQKESETIVYPLIKEKEVKSNNSLYYNVSNDMNLDVIFTYKMPAEYGSLSINNQEEIFKLDRYFYCESLSGDFIDISEISKIIADDLYESVPVNPLDEDKVINRNVPYYQLEIPEKEKFGILKITQIDPINQIEDEVEWKLLGTDSANELGEKYLSRALDLDGEDIYMEIIDGEEIRYVEVYTHLGVAIDNFKADDFYFYLTVFDGNRVIRCSNVIVISKEQYAEWRW